MVGGRAARAAAIAIGVWLAAGQAEAGSITLTFGALPNAVAIENYYNGGLSGYPPAGTGPDYGLVFSAPANEQRQTLTNPPPRPGTGKFENNPSGAVGVLYFPFSSTSAGYINDARGFKSLSFTYSLLDNVLPPDTTYDVDIYSGLNGTGALLGSLALTPGTPTVACKKSFDEFCTWSTASIALTGLVGESVVFNPASTTLLAEFDSVTIAVPEPRTWVMALAGLAGLGALKLRRRRAIAA